MYFCAIKSDKEKYEVVPIYISKDRTWYTGDSLLEITPAAVTQTHTIGSSVNTIKVLGTGMIKCSTSEELNSYNDLPENTLAIVIDNYYKGTYQLIEGQWEQIGEPVNVGDDTLTQEQYDNAVLSIDNILGINEEEQKNE